MRRFLVLAFLLLASSADAQRVAMPKNGPFLRDDGTGTIRIYDEFGAEVVDKSERHVATALAVELNSASETTLFTVPSGRSFFVTRVLVWNANGTILPAFRGNFGFNAGVDDVAALVRLDEASQGKFKMLGAAPGAPVGTEGQALKFKPTAAHGSSRTVRIDVFGILM